MERKRMGTTANTWWTQIDKPPDDIFLSRQILSTSSAYLKRADPPHVYPKSTKHFLTYYGKQQTSMCDNKI